MNKIAYRNWQMLLLLLTIGVLSITLYLQYHEYLQPCSLCLMQRFCASVFGIMAIGALFVKTKRMATGMMIGQVIMVSLGVFFALRQLWLQSLPQGELAACLPALDVMIQYLPWHVVLKTLLWGGGSCGEVSWSFGGLSMATWSLIYFVFNTVIGLWLVSRLCLPGRW